MVTRKMRVGQEVRGNARTDSRRSGWPCRAIYAADLEISAIRVNGIGCGFAMANEGPSNGAREDTRLPWPHHGLLNIAPIAGIQEGQPCLASRTLAEGVGLPSSARSNEFPCRRRRRIGAPRE